MGGGGDRSLSEVDDSSGIFMIIHSTPTGKKQMKEQDPNENVKGPEHLRTYYDNTAER